jgi:hypothetical protein
MIRNFFRQSQPWTKNISPELGRWRRQDNVKKIKFSNYDICDDTCCRSYAKYLSKSSEKRLKTNPQNIKKDQNIDNKSNIKSNKKIKNSNQDMIDDYNIRWKQNLTIGQYYKYFN